MCRKGNLNEWVLIVPIINIKGIIEINDVVKALTVGAIAVEQ